MTRSDPSDAQNPGRNARSVRLREENELLEAGGKRLRRQAALDAQAGTRGEYAAYALAAMLDDIRMGVDPRTDALAACRALLTGPDGQNDPRRRGSQGSAPDGS